MPDLASFDKNGCGMAWYPTGEVAVNALPKDGGLHLHFFNNDKRHTSLGMWTIPEGIGFLNYPSGKPRLVIHRKGGSYVNSNGAILQKWRWNLRRKYTGPETGISFNINSNLSFNMSGPEDIFMGAARMVITYRNICKEFNVGRQVFKTVGHKRLTKIVNGKEVGVSLLDRQNRSTNKNLKTDPFEDIHARNLSYPKLSCSGREVLRVKLPRSLQAIENNWKDVHHRIDTGEFSSSLTKLKQFHASLRGTNALTATINYFPKLHAIGDKSAKLERISQVPSANCRSLFKTPRLKSVSDKKLFNFVSNWCSKPENSNRLLIVFVTNRLTSESRVMEKMLMNVMKRWRQQSHQNSKQSNDEVTNSKNHSNNAKKDKEKKNVTSKKSLEKAFIIMCNSCHSSIVSTQLGFQTFPMILMYYRGDLTFAGNTFANCSKTESSFLETVNIEYGKAISGICLPKDFCFESRFFSGKNRNHRGIQGQHHCVWSKKQ